MDRNLGVVARTIISAVQRFVLVALFLIGVNVAQAPSYAKTAKKKAGSCDYPNRVSSCTEMDRKALHAVFGLPPLKAMYRQQKTAGATNDLIVGIAEFKLGGGLALIFQRDRQGNPWAEIYEKPPLNGAPQTMPLRARIPEAIWNEVVAKGRSLDTEYYDDRICVGGGAFTVEAMDSAGAIRARVGEVCGGDPGIELFSFLADTAVAQIPHCAALQPDTFNSGLNKLKDCFALNGEKRAAADLYNLLEASQILRSIGRADPSEIQFLFDVAISLSWSGVPPVRGPEAASEFWGREWLFPVRLKYENIHAETNDRVRVEGYVTSEEQEGQGWRKGRTGSFTSVWIRGKDGNFRIRKFSYSGKKIKQPS